MRKGHGGDEKALKQNNTFLLVPSIDDPNFGLYKIRALLKLK